MAGEGSVFRERLFRGRSVLVTGGGTGIGFAIADLFARLGADVAVASRRPEHLDPAAEHLAKHGVRALSFPLNVRDPAAVATTVPQIAQALGRLDVLVNNAAGNFYAPSATLSPNGWRAVIETDLFGTFFCSQAAHPIMKAQGGGRIVSISMTLHYRGWPMMAHATAAKAGVDALTRTLALEWAADGITVNAVAPGPIPTEGATAAFATGTGPAARPIDDTIIDTVPLGRLGSAGDVAHMVAYLASPAGAWITGAIMVVDGGSSLAQPRPSGGNSP